MDRLPHRDELVGVYSVHPVLLDPEAEVPFLQEVLGLGEQLTDDEPGLHAALEAGPHLDDDRLEARTGLLIEPFEHRLGGIESTRRQRAHALGLGALHGARLGDLDAGEAELHSAAALAEEVAPPVDASRDALPREPELLLATGALVGAAAGPGLRRPVHAALSGSTAA